MIPHIGETAFDSSSVKTYSLLVLLLILPVICIGMPAVHAGSVETYLALGPTTYVANQIGEVFNMNVDITGAANVQSVHLTLVYDTSLLRVNRVVRGSLIPSPPKSSFSFDINELLGSVGINISISSSAMPIGGNGTLAVVTFQVTGTPRSCDGSPISLRSTVLLDPKSVPIVHDTIGAVYFWKQMGLDPPVSGRFLDLYTQKGGLGRGTPDGFYVSGDMVILTSLVTFNAEPVQQKLVSFEVHDPSNATVLFRSGTTDSHGLTSVSFRIPADPSSTGTWTAISLVEIAEETVWDTVTFYVNILFPTGGYSTSTAQTVDATPFPLYAMLGFLVLAVFIATQRHRLKNRLSEI